MFRNLVLKLPSLKCTSEYAFSSACRKRCFRSLSPLSRLQPDVSAGAKRSASSSRTERIHSLADTREKTLARTLCFSGNKPTEVEEIQWKEKPSVTREADRRDDIPYTTSENVQFETLEQYELEAARPRSTKSSDLIEAFSSRSKPDRYYHLQPSQIKPYGSCENFYSPSLIRPTNALQYPKKFKKRASEDTSEPEANYKLDKQSSSRGYRRFSTLSLSTPIKRRLSTTKSCIAKEGHSTKDQSCDGSDIKLSKYRIALGATPEPRPMHEQYTRRNLDAHEDHWSLKHKAYEFSPPSFQPFSERNNQVILEMSTPAMRKRRITQENQKGSLHFKSSYSDLIKQKLREKSDIKLGLTNEVNNYSTSSDKMCTGCILKDSGKSNKMLEAFSSPPGRRSITTRSKSNIFSNEHVSILESNNPSLESEHKPGDQKYYSKHSSKVKKGKRSEKVQQYNPECEDICTPITKALEKKTQRRFAYEPDRCKDDDQKPKKVYLPSKVKLPVVPCTPRPDYRDCVKIDQCTAERADECLEIKPKQLPKLLAGNCECVEEPQPSKAPRLQRLKLKFDDPPRGPCHVPPCQTPRADDSNPYKHKPLKPYVPGECACIEPPPMIDVKLKRLPRCQPEEVCNPPRICPEIETCPPRADECYKVVPKKLPPLVGPPCPCVEIPPPTMAPPLRRLDLHVPEPERVCPKPPPCDLDRADKDLKPKRKKLPKFVPGECRCEDKPLVDWNLKRLVCEDEVQECIVPDPCKTFPRADWGCWEYSQEVCDVVDEKCVEKKEKCVKPKVKPCRKKSICETGAGPLDYRNVSTRKFSISTSGSSYKLYQKMKSKSGSHPKEDNNDHNREETGHQKNKNVKSAPKSKRALALKVGTKKEPTSAIHLIKELNDFDKSHKENKAHPLLFKPKKIDKLDYQSILNTIASTSLKLEKKSSSLRTELRKPKVNTLTIPSRAISTTEYLSKDESDTKKEKECKAKEKCKNIRPSIKSLICKRSCPRYQVCTSVGREHKPNCRKERVPVCCEKEEPPYTAFTDNLPDSIEPFTATPQWTCNRKQYGFHPVYRKEYEPYESKRDKQTFPLTADLPLSDDFRMKELTSSNVTSAEGDEVSKTNTHKEKSCLSNKDNKPGSLGPLSKGLLKGTTLPNVSASHSRPFTTKIFQIRPPEVCKKPKGRKECKNKMREEQKPPKISCLTTDICRAQDKRNCCFRNFKSNNAERKSPPFPAFSDCLDEEMEDILTECPLDKEKYLRMQPRFMDPPPKPLLLKPPPPNQGKIDILKEQECIREKLCLNNEGISQSCTDFGKPVPLMKPQKEENRDCQRMEELKRLGRWPPFTLKSNRRYSTAANVSDSKFRSYSTLGLNSIKEVVTEKIYNESRRIYIRNYHALLKCADQSVFADSEEKLKKITQNTLPILDKKIQATKTENDQWRIQNFNMYGQIINKQSNLTRKVRRYFSTYRIRRQNGLKNKLKRQSVGSSNRTISSFSPILRRKMQYFRGNRYYKSGNSKKIDAEKQKCKIKSRKKECSKFTLKNCPPKASRVKCHRIAESKDCTKPFSPYPAYSECKEHELIAPSCECGYEVERMIDLQPRFSLLNEKPAPLKEFPSQERIDRALGIEYLKCKHGISNEGQTIGCESLVNHSHQRRKKEPQAQEVCQKQEEPSKDICDEGKDTRSSKEAPDSCEPDRKKIEDICVTECLKSIPCHLPEEEKYCICKANCEKLFEEGNSNPQDPPTRNDMDEEKCTSKPAEADCSKHQQNNEITNLSKQTCTEESEKPVCKDMVLKSSGLQTKKSKSLTQLEKIWQKVVNYFKARPNCPEPGDYKKKALRDKAEKAAVAAGVIVVDPKCLPPGILKMAKAPKKDCKVCPNQDPCDSKKSGTRSSSPETNRRNFSTNHQPFRKYSKSISCKNLDEINRILEDGEAKQKEVLFKNMRKPIYTFDGGKDAVASEEVRLSLDMEIRNDVDLSQLCEKDRKYSKTYFGYSDILPSRENILERAWRMSIEANEKHYPRSYNLFNEFLSTVEKSGNTVEDLEKMKTENVLRELDKFLKNVDPDPTTKKKK